MRASFCDAIRVDALKRTVIRFLRYWWEWHGPISVTTQFSCVLLCCLISIWRIDTDSERVGWYSLAYHKCCNDELRSEVRVSVTDLMFHWNLVTFWILAPTLFIVSRKNVRVGTLTVYNVIGVGKCFIYVHCIDDQSYFPKLFRDNHFQCLCLYFNWKLFFAIFSNNHGNQWFSWAFAVQPKNNCHYPYSRFYLEVKSTLKKGSKLKGRIQ